MQLLYEAPRKKPVPVRESSQDTRDQSTEVGKFWMDL